MNELDQVLTEGIAFAEGIFTETCRITTAGDRSTLPNNGWNEETMTYDEPPRVVVYDNLRCRLQIKSDMNSNVVEATSGDREWTYQTANLEVPVAGTENVLPEMQAEILTAKYDPSLVGRVVHIEGIYRKSQSTRRRFRVKEVTG